jgi:dihydroorotase-like cyclic amidohydrolase
VGADADLVVLDADPRAVRASELASAVDYSPYEGMQLAYWPAATVCGGQLVYEDGQFVADDYRGELINLRYREPSLDPIV